MLYAAIFIAVVAGYVALQYAIEPLDRFLSERLWRKARMARRQRTHHAPGFARKPAKHRPIRVTARGMH
jgi:hypothetical protein